MTPFVSLALALRFLVAFGVTAFDAVADSPVPQL